MILEARGREPISLVLLCGLVVGVVAACGGDQGRDTAAMPSAEIEAQDTEAQSTLRLAQTAMEVYATDHNGSYAGADAQELEAIEPALRAASVEVTANRSTYELAVESESGTTFSLARTANGAVRYECDPPGAGDCRDDGKWG
jgi:hypothetical protein